jgi:hypothetical protein
MAADLVAFLRARLDEDEQVARTAEAETSAVWTAYSESVDEEGGGAVATGSYGYFGDQRHHIARHDPARVLAEVDAKRDVIRLAERAHDYHATFVSGFAAAMEDALRKFALAYADHPDYKPEWAPDA